MHVLTLCQCFLNTCSQFSHSLSLSPSLSRSISGLAPASADSGKFGGRFLCAGHEPRERPGWPMARNHGCLAPLNEVNAMLWGLCSLVISIITTRERMSSGLRKSRMPAPLCGWSVWLLCIGARLPRGLLSRPRRDGGPVEVTHDML